MSGMDPRRWPVEPPRQQLDVEAFVAGVIIGTAIALTVAVLLKA